MSNESDKASSSNKSATNPLKDLIGKRSSIKGQITKFKNYLDRLSQSTSIISLTETAELKIKLHKFDSLSTRFEDLQTQIEVLNSQNLEQELMERESIEQEIVQNIVVGQMLLKEYDNLSREEHGDHFNVNTGSSDHRDLGFKLPQIQISKFNGSYFRWLEFRDTFLNLVHNNERIASIHKFHYLLSYLEGDAARIISNLEVSSANYTEAWSLLNERYNNKRILINNHLDSLFNIQTLTKQSEASLRFLVDHVTKNLRALASLGQPTAQWDILIIYMLSSKLDVQTNIKWEEYRNTLDDVPNLEQFKKFLIDRADVLEALNRNKINNNNQQNISSHSGNSMQATSSKTQYAPRPFQSQFKNQNNFVRNNINSYSINNSKNMSSYAALNQNKSNIYHCVVCDGSHRIYDCPIFKANTIKDKMSCISKYKLCLNCLRQGHPLSECRMGPCRVCNQMHNTLVHDPSVSVNCCTDEIQVNSSIVSFAKQNSSQVLLSTAMIEVCDPISNKIERVRALLDSGSQSTFITKSLQNKLLLSRNASNTINVIGIGNTCSNTNVESCVAQLKSLNSNYQVTLSCYVLNQLTGSLPKAHVEKELLKLPKSIILADPKFDQPAPIDVLIGADIFWDILGCEERTLGPNLPKLRSSQFGWIIGGTLNAPMINNTNKIHCNHVLTSDSKVDEMLTKFWEIEELPRKTVLGPEEKAIEEHFLNNTKRLASGRFSVRLPLKDSPDCLGDSYYQAKRRFLNLEKRFRKNPQLKLQYVEFIREYHELGHLSESKVVIPNTSYFLCHHAVFKEDSESTKIRVVFDGSAPSTSGYSVNDILMIGPNVQSSLFSILIRARQYKYILTGDITKMYRQVEVDDKDRNLQLILWREDESLPIKTLKLNTVTYGTASASYLSTKCLWQIGQECEDDLIKTIIQNDFYVDDLVTGCDSEIQLQYIQNSVSKALNSACFPLRKYKTNLTSILQNPVLNSQDNLTFSESSSTLGLGWDPKTDTFNFPTKKIIKVNNNKITKRYILSNSFSIFDPLGILSPCIIQPKILIQKLWLKGVDWDQPVSNDVLESWNDISQKLCVLSDLKIPRRVICDLPELVEIHCFSDASQLAYGACIYVRSKNNAGVVTSKLLCAKSKVAPIKPTTIPRLELCAALLSAKLCKNVLESLRNSIAQIYYWCDSTIVLGWLKTNPSKLKTYVANRISTIQEITNSKSWRYVPTNYNPADLISRGLNAEEICHSNLWWYGPPYLLKNESEWPMLNMQNSLLLPETKVVNVITNEVSIDFKRFSNFNKLQRSFAYVLRFLHNAKPSNSNNKLKDFLSVNEINRSFYNICMLVQKTIFSSEYQKLKNNQCLSSTSKLLALSPFFDHNSNVIRVGGRLESSNYTYEKRHPILLDSNHYVTKLLFEREHIRNMHAGPQLLLASIREYVWPLNGRKLARRVVKNCVTCVRLRGETLTPKMGNLPSNRVSVDFPFKSVGIDYAGPFLILNRKGRGATLLKCYLCIFICLRFKCIHLEAVCDLSKEAFIMTFRRFVARRGKPTEVFSDNGRNFVAAAKDFSYFLNNNHKPISEFACQEGINFNFIPAYAPHFGGIWEAGVKSAKYHIRRVMGNSHLTFEEISTLFAQVEAILNSRPLCPLSASPTDFLSLSPGHFLIGRPLNALPAPNMESKRENSLNRYARIEKIRQHFWNRWQKEYICELQQRTKWRNDKSKLKIGDMVLIQEDNVPPLCWRLGRVMRLFPGSDGIVRVADINTTRGCVRRALVRLCPLPTSLEEDSS